jgi:type II secretory pathway pseudopilin PulG
MVHFQKGQTLIEVVIALSAIAIVISAITVAVISSLSNAQFAKDQNLATQYAQQGTELVRVMRNDNYGLFKDLNGTYCLAKSCTTLSNDQTDNSCGPKQGQTCGQNTDIYVREITIQQPSATQAGCNKYSYLINVTVSWTDHSCVSTSNPFCHNVNLVSCLSDSGIIIAP